MPNALLTHSSLPPPTSTPRPAAGLFDGLGGDVSGDEGSSGDESYGGGFGGSASSARYFERAGVAEDEDSEDEGGMYS